MLSILGHKGNANQTTLTFQLTPVRMPTIKNTNNNNVDQDVGKKEHLCTAGGNVN
jgi:hypothetical protein